VQKDGATPTVQVSTPACVADRVGTVAGLAINTTALAPVAAEAVLYDLLPCPSTAKMLLDVTVASTQASSIDLTTSMTTESSSTVGRPMYALQVADYPSGSRCDGLQQNIAQLSTGTAAGSNVLGESTAAGLLGLLLAVGLPAALVVLARLISAKSSRRTGASMTSKSRCAIAAIVLLCAPRALAVTAITDVNINRAVAAWMNDTAKAAASYGSIGDWNVAAVSNMESLLNDDVLQNPTFNADISAWNTASVSSMAYIFAQQPTFNADISKWNTARVKNMESTFALASAFNQDISKWDTRRVTTISGTFFSASAFNQDISQWNTAAVTTMQDTFLGASAFNQNVVRWNTASVTDMSATFNAAPAFNRDISQWNTAAVTTMLGIFTGASAFNRDISKWNTAAMTTMSLTFNLASAFNADISQWNTARVQNMGGTFKAAPAFNRDISQWNTAAVTTLGGTFGGAAAFNADVSKWNVLGVNAAGWASTWTGAALDGCKRRTIYAAWGATFQSVWPTLRFPPCTVGSNACAVCISDTNIGGAVTAWVTSPSTAVTTYGNIGDWNTAALSSMASVFASKPTFNADISKWNTAAVSNMMDSFNGA
jgi:surface protein